MDWKKIIGIVMQILAILTGLRAGEYNAVSKMPQADPGFTVAGVPASTIGLGTLATGLAAGGVYAFGAGKGTGTAKRSVTSALHTIAADAVESGDTEYMDKLRDLAITISGRVKVANTGKPAAPKEQASQ